MPQVIYEMSRKKLGMTTVLRDGLLAGMISDGDLRRLLERDGSHALEHTAAEIMNSHPSNNRRQRPRLLCSGPDGRQEDNLTHHHRRRRPRRRSRPSPRSLGAATQLTNRTETTQIRLSPLKSNSPVDAPLLVTACVACRSGPPSNSFTRTIRRSGFDEQMASNFAF